MIAKLNTLNFSNYEGTKLFFFQRRPVLPLSQGPPAAGQENNEETGLYRLLRDVPILHLLPSLLGRVIGAWVQGGVLFGIQFQLHVRRRQPNAGQQQDVSSEKKEVVDEKPEEAKKQAEEEQQEQQQVVLR